jgi:HEAT repeat protein
MDVAALTITTRHASRITSGFKLIKKKWSGHPMNSRYCKLAILVAGMFTVMATLSIAQESGTAELLKAAASGAGPTRYAAIDDLGETRRDAAQVVPQLQKLLADKDPQVRWRAARALGDYGELASSAAAALRDRLADGDPMVQYHATVSFGKIADTSGETIDALVKAVTSRDKRVARAAIAALRALKPSPEHLAAAMEHALTSDDDAVQLHAIEAIVERGADAAPVLNAALKRPKTAYLACTAIEQIGPDASATVPAIVELLGKTRHSHLQIQALLALASIGPAAKSAAPIILPLLDSPSDVTVPVAAAYALGSIGVDDERTRAALQRATTKDNEFLQMIAAWSLAKTNRNDQAAMRLAVEKLTRGLKSNKVELRTAAAKALQMLQAPPELVTHELIALANDPDPDVQTNVINAVASLGESVVPRAVAALEDPQLRESAVRVLMQLGPKAAGAVQPLINAAKGAAPELHTQINFALAAIGPAASPAAGMLAEAIANDNEGVRESALFALREIGPGAKPATAALLKRMQADQSFDALASAWALARVAPDDAATAAKAVSKLTEGLSSADERIRLECVEALAAWKSVSKPSAGKLQQVANEDNSPVVRAAAAAALEQIKSTQ